MAKQLSTQTVFRNWLKQLCSEQSVRQSSLGASTSTPTSKGQQPVHRLWRIWFVTQHTAQAESGFILPTVTLLLLMVSLIIGLLISRTYSRTAQVIGNRQQTALYNAASPAVDRAKAKIEYLFTQSPLPPLPSDSDINTELANRDSYDLPAVGGASAETRFDINNDGTLDNAWYYSADVDGDNDNETIAYSILTNASATYNSTDYVLESTVNQNKAQSLVVRNGPINLSSSAGSTCQNAQTSPFAGWEPVTSSKLRKAVQVHAVVFDQSNTGMPTSATLEMQQDREANLGNKWGAWFRYDLQLHAGSRFNFNGAMHTEGSFIIRGTDSVNGSAPTDSSYLYLVSSPESCIYTSDASDISMAESDDFQGQFLIGAIADNSVDEDYKLFVDRYVANSFDDTKDRISFTPNQTLAATANKDSVLDNAAGKNLPSEIALNPIRLFTDGISVALTGLEDNTDARDSATNWSDDRPAIGAVDRIVNSETPIPFLDDTYRADNRWGPKPLYTDELSVPSASQYGATITSNTDDLLEQDPMAGNPLDEEGYGYDGYWERRAKDVGARVIVGQRLELGNATEWTNNDPLYPPADNAYSGMNATMSARDNELRQWRTLRDNLAAAQATAVYHYQSNNGDYPVACLATTAHPGTQITDINSRTFVYADLDGAPGTVITGENLVTNFYTGQGTNGIEFSPPFAGNAGTFATEVNKSNSPIRIALTNLAYFAGDPSGAFPPVQDPSTGKVHPYPVSTMWGNFSELRRVITALERGTTYANLSPADKTTLHTATCTIGMIAYATDLQTDVFEKNADLFKIDDGPSQQEYGALQKLLDNTASAEAECSATGKATCAPNPYDRPKNPQNGEIWQLASANDTVTGLDTDSPNLSCDTNLANTGIVRAANASGNANAPNYSTVWLNIPASGLTDAPAGGSTSTGDPSTWSSTESSAFLGQFTIAQWMCALMRGPGGAQLDSEAEVEELMKKVLNLGRAALNVENFQLYRDRAYGFRDGKVDLNQIGFTTGAIPYQNGLVCYSGLSSPDNSGVNCTVGSSTGQLALPTTCNPTTLKELLNVPGGAVGLNDPSIVTALTFCDEEIISTFDILYPSLFYLFPFVSHAHDGSYQDEVGDLNSPTWMGTAGDRVTNAALVNYALGLVGASSFPTGSVYYDSGNTAPGSSTSDTTAIQKAIPALDVVVKDSIYTQDTYLYANNSGTLSGINAYKDSAPSTRFYYRPVEDGVGIGDYDGIVDLKNNAESFQEFVNYLGVEPRNKTIADVTSTATWTTPVVRGTANLGASPNASRANYIYVDVDRDNVVDTNADNIPDDTGDLYFYPAFLDVGMFDGREQMGIRSLSIDLDLLRRYKYDPTANSGAGGAVANCTLNTPSGDTTDANGQCWLPLPTLLEDNGGTTTSGAIIYAFREDAVREDAIARPTSTDTTGFTCDADETLGTKDDEHWLSLWSSYVAATSFTTPTSTTRANSALAIDDFLMDAVGATGYFDPPKNPCTGVSPKPVDFYADPDRRPHGFMLTNGSDLRRTDGSNYDTESRGMSFISDNPVYIKGDFNVHYDRTSTDGTNTTIHEEFGDDVAGDLLDATWSNFYTRTDLNDEFADPANDSWRVVEIISDAVTVLSANFEPGFIVEGLLWQTDYSKRNSFGAMRIPRIGSAEPTSNQKASEQTNSTNTSAVGVTKWVLEDGENAVDTFNASGWRAITSPIKIDRSGLPIYNQSTTATEDFVVYGLTSTNKANEYLESLTYSNDSHNARSRITAVLAASSSQVSTVLVSGISPSRQNQNYGGLHNFLSLIENWTQNSVNLDFSGSMIQLNFRTYGASFDQDSWEPQNNVSGTANRYYLEPTRNWGYDPALQYAPAGPVARRFVASGNTRSEFYRELSTNDPYVINLRCAYKPGTTTRIDPNVNASLCPF